MLLGLKSEDFCVRRGVFRNLDKGVGARGFWGTQLNHGVGQPILGTL